LTGGLLTGCGLRGCGTLRIVGEAVCGECQQGRHEQLLHSKLLHLAVQIEQVASDRVTRHENSKTWNHNPTKAGNVPRAHTKSIPGPKVTRRRAGTANNQQPLTAEKR